jgi:hypothetical protein
MYIVLLGRNSIFTGMGVTLVPIIIAKDLERNL